MKRIAAVVLLSFVLLSAGCDRPAWKEGDFFFLEREGAVLPIWVRGNTASGRLVVYLHGGPGMSGIVDALGHDFGGVEKDYAIAYFDQRMSGSAQGNPADSTLTIESMGEDVDQVVDLVRFKYGVEKVVLMGHSWGGFLGTAYVLDERHQAKVSAWIEVDGAHNHPLALELSRQWTLDQANDYVARGENLEYWQAAKRWLEEHPLIDLEEEVQILVEFAATAGAYAPLDAPETPQDMTELSFYSPAAGMQLLNTPPQLRAHLQFNFHTLNLSPELQRVRLPVLLAWGRKDFIVPIGCMDDAKAHLTQAPVVETAVFEQSGHAPMAHEKDAFNDTVLDFLRRNAEGGAR